MISFKRLENGVGLPSFLKLNVTIKVTKKSSYTFLPVHLLYVCVYVFARAPASLYVSACFSPLAFLCLFQLSLGLWPEFSHLSLFFFLFLPLILLPPTQQS